MDKHFTINDYEYCTDLDIEEDNRKYWHYCFKNGHQIKMSSEFYNHSPYRLMTREEFTKHIMTVEVFIQG